MNSTLVQANTSIQFLRDEQLHGLLFCWRIRAGFKKTVEIGRIKNYASWFFENNLTVHFQLEEDLFFPLLKNNPDLIKKTKAIHRRLTRLFKDSADNQKSLSFIEEELENYLLFEKHVLSSEIQSLITKKELALIRKLYLESLSFEDWGDPFWKE